MRAQLCMYLSEASSYSGTINFTTVNKNHIGCSVNQPQSFANDRIRYESIFLALPSSLVNSDRSQYRLDIEHIDGDCIAVKPNDIGILTTNSLIHTQLWVSRPFSRLRNTMVRACGACHLSCWLGKKVLQKVQNIINSQINWCHSYTGNWTPALSVRLDPYEPVKATNPSH